MFFGSSQAATAQRDPVVLAAARMLVEAEMATDSTLVPASGSLVKQAAHQTDQKTDFDLQLEEIFPEQGDQIGRSSSQNSARENPRNSWPLLDNELDLDESASLRARQPSINQKRNLTAYDLPGSPAAPTLSLIHI